jgi:hypothetical protein
LAVAQAAFPAVAAVLVATVRLVAVLAVAQMMEPVAAILVPEIQARSRASTKTRLAATRIGDAQATTRSPAFQAILTAMGRAAV